MGHTLSLGDIKAAQKPSIPEVFQGFRVGDRIRVHWNNTEGEKGMGKESYKKEGVIVQITDSSIYYRCSSGYVCGVSKNQVRAGVKVQLCRRAEN